MYINSTCIAMDPPLQRDLSTPLLQYFLCPPASTLQHFSCLYTLHEVLQHQDSMPDMLQHLVRPESTRKYCNILFMLNTLLQHIVIQLVAVNPQVSDHWHRTRQSINSQSNMYHWMQSIYTVNSRTTSSCVHIVSMIVSGGHSTR